MTLKKQINAYHLKKQKKNKTFAYINEFFFAVFFFPWRKASANIYIFDITFNTCLRLRIL